LLKQTTGSVEWFFELTTDRLRVRSAIRCIAVKVGVSDEVTVCVVIAFRVLVVLYFVGVYVIILRICHSQSELLRQLYYSIYLFGIIYGSSDKGI